MKMPFTTDQFFELFRRYNETLWPTQVFLLILAVIVIALVLRPRPWTGRVISGILAFLWFWLALAYHLAFFSRINPLAYGFSLVSLIGAFVFVWQGLIRRRLEFAWRWGPRAILGVLLVVYALGVYPLWSAYAGHLYPAMPTFGLPCPTTIFTIGILVFARPVYPRSPLIVPALWCLIGGQAAFALNVAPDYGLFAAFLVAVGLLVRRPAT